MSSAVVFPGAAGRVCVVDDAVAQMTLLTVSDSGDDQALEASAATGNGVDSLAFSLRRSLVTRFMIGQETNQQFLHTLGGDIHLYVFGDRMGRMQIDGMSIADECSPTPPDCDPLSDNNAPVTTLAGTGHGIEKMLDFYGTNRLSQRATPLRMLIGRKTHIKGFLLSFSASVVNPDLRMVQYSLGFAVVPPDTTPSASLLTGNVQAIP